MAPGQHFRPGHHAIQLIVMTLLLVPPQIHAQTFDIPALIEQCAPEIHPTTMLAVLQQESGLKPFVIGVNGDRPRAIHSKTAGEATQQANQLLATGNSIDMGLGQINSNNLAKLKLTTETVFDPCINIKASAYLLQEAYERMSTKHGEGPEALDSMLSIYNTGNAERGRKNGYVGRVRAKTYRVPSLADSQPPIRTQAIAEDPDREPPRWDTYARSRWDAEQRGRWDPYARAHYGEDRDQETAPATKEAEPTAVMLFESPDRSDTVR